MTLQPRCEDVETAEGVAITVTGVAQVKARGHDLNQLPINSESAFFGSRIGMQYDHLPPALFSYCKTSVRVGS